MSKAPFRVKPYAHGKYKFLVRWKVLGKWRRRYFKSEAEAIAFSKQQNANAQHGNGNASSQPNGASDESELTSPRPAERLQPQRSSPPRDFSSLLSPDYLGPRIERYLGDSWCMHLPFAYDLMREFAPTVFVELGVKQGESYFAFCQSAAENKINVRCYGIDSWQGDIQTGKLDPEIQREATDYNWRYSSFSELKAMLFAEALADFPDASIDLLHIDGTHTYEDVKADFESWLPKMSPNGIILLHDVLVRDRGFGVWRLWEEITREGNSFLFDFGHGLGVWKKQSVRSTDSSLVRRLLRATATERHSINEYYANAAAALALWQSAQKLAAAEEQIALLTSEAEERSNHVAQLQRDLEQKAQQLAHPQHELDEGSRQATQLKAEAEEGSRRLAQLNRDVDEKTRQLTHLQWENDRQSQLLEELKHQLDTATDHLSRAGNELLDARWEALTLRGTSLRRAVSVEAPSIRILDLENRAETATSERDHLRNMLESLQKDLDQRRIAEQSKEEDLKTVQTQLKVATKKLQSARKQMDRLRDSLSRKLILPFGRSQRKLQQLATTRRADD